MKNNGVLSAIVGGTFFAASYLALSVSLVPSLVIGGAAFCAGELVFKKDKKSKLKYTNPPLYKILEEAKIQNSHILDMLPIIESDEMRLYMNGIHDSVNKIIAKIEKTPSSSKRLNNFFEYYLPVTIKIINRYNEIEDQDLTSNEIKKFNKSTICMLKEANNAFKKMLNNLYSNELIDGDVEMKVFNSMLKSDGLNKELLDVKDKE